MTNLNYLLPVTDGLPVRSSGEWAGKKLDYVQRYIELFETAMRNKWSQRNYIDLFAGPGKVILKDSGNILLGSPILTLVTKHPFTGYYFSELSQENAAALKLRCEASPIYHRVSIFAENANVVVSKIVARINRSSLNLAFLDPEGLELEWSTVEQLGTLRCDLIINYSQQGLSRYIGIAYKSENETSVDRFFGTSGWREIYASYHLRPRKTGLHRDLLDFYKDRLQSLGYQDIQQADVGKSAPLMRNTQRNAPLYRLIFASKHPLGEDFWEKITMRDRNGQERMF